MNYGVTLTWIWTMTHSIWEKLVDSVSLSFLDNNMTNQ